jgi:hypothetical protein
VCRCKNCDLRIKNGILVEHWDVIQDEATREQSKSGNPMFGDTFPTHPEVALLFCRVRLSGKKPKDKAYPKAVKTQSSDPIRNLRSRKHAPLSIVRPERFSRGHFSARLTTFSCVAICLIRPALPRFIPSSQKKAARKVAHLATTISEKRGDAGHKNQTERFSLKSVE